MTYATVTYTARDTCGHIYLSTVPVSRCESTGEAKASVRAWLTAKGHRLIQIELATLHGNGET